MRTFSLREARTLLPVLRSLLERTMAAKNDAEAAQQWMTLLSHRIHISGGMLVDVRKAARRRAELQDAVRRASDAMQEIEAIGVQVKDLDTGLLDFPFQMGDEVVLLCWKMGEDDINFWHGTEEGFRGRKALDWRFEAPEHGGGDSDAQSGERRKPN